MRLIGTIHNEQEALAFSHFLSDKGIQHHLEIHENHDWGSPEYGTNECQLWIDEEDHVAEAIKIYNQFLENPLDPIFKATTASPLTTSVSSIKSKMVPNETSDGIRPSESRAPISTLWEKQPMGPITKFFLFLCTALFIFGELVPSTKKGPDGREEKTTFFSSPVSKALLYDFPRFYELLDKFIGIYGYEALEHPEQLSPEGQDFYKITMNVPYWKGYYDMMMDKGIAAVFDWRSYPPLFEKIQQGQFWRTFSPALMHADIFHLFFNMLWLIVLGKQIEQRLKPLTYILFIILLGVFSNTAQYLVGGPNFLRFSGILCGMLTFIWVRQRQTPWEGYLLDRTTFLFMTVFVLGMAAMQLISFFVEKSFHMDIAPNIANTAHISGALGGYILGRCNFFSWRKTT